MYRVIFPEGQLECSRYEETEFGVDLYNGDDEFLAFIPYTALHAIIDEETHSGESVGEPSVM